MVTKLLILFLSSSTTIAATKPCKDSSCLHRVAIGLAVDGEVLKEASFCLIYEPIPYHVMLGPFCLMKWTRKLVEKSYYLTKDGSPLIECNKEMLERLDHFLQSTNETIKPKNVEEHLKREAWFSCLKDDQKKLVAWQAGLTLRQELSYYRTRYLAETAMATFDFPFDNSSYWLGIDERKFFDVLGSGATETLRVAKHFTKIKTDRLGRLLKDEDSEKFVKAALKPWGGLRELLAKILPALTDSKESIWAKLDFACEHQVVRGFVARLLLSNFVLRRVALALEGKIMSRKEGDEFMVQPDDSQHGIGF